MATANRSNRSGRTNRFAGLALPLLQAAVVMLTVDDWDVRFIAPVLFAVFVLAASSLSLPPWPARRPALPPGR